MSASQAQNGGRPTKINRCGATRIVILAGHYAIKLPRWDYGWKTFLQGLLCNMQEACFGRLGWAGFCPVVGYVPGGFLVIMPRAVPLADAEFDAFDAAAFCERGDYLIPAEHKSDSFGWLNGEIVCLDYGS